MQGLRTTARTSRKAATVTDIAHVVPLTGRRHAAPLLAAAFAACLIAGIVGVAIAGTDSAWTGLLSLAIPGLGQLVRGDVLLGVVLLLAFLFVLVDLYLLFNRTLRFGIVPLVVLAPAAALEAATGGPWWMLLVGGAVGIAVGIGIEQVNFTAKQHRLARVADALAEQPTRVTTPAHEAVEHGTTAPLDQYSEAYLQYFLRFGSAEPTDWTVFDDPKHMDSALRYQMVLAGWALFVSQHLVTPAYRQAAATSLGNFAERCRDHRVWSYTRRQNLSSFRLDGDPFRHENVMYSGYAADVLSMYEALSGDERYDAPGGYAVSDDSRTYSWSHAEIIENLAAQHAASPHGAISCVPGWLWPPCQTFSLRAIQLADLVHDTDHTWALERFSESFARYFIDADGHIDTCRNIAGFTHPTEPMIVGVSGQAGTGAMMAPFGREHVASNYEQQVLPRVNAPDDEGRQTLRMSKIDTFDTSYGWNPAQPYSLALLYATEMGDTETAAGLRRTLEDMLTPDGSRPGPGSILSMAFTFLALINTERGLTAAHRHVPARDTTPELEQAPYPQVVVTSARTEGDGVRTTLTPGPAANGPVRIGFARLVPGSGYRVSGIADTGEAPSRTADATGRIEIEVPSAARQELLLERV
jgi:hypothetical protein